MQTNEKPQHTPGPWKVSNTGQGLMISSTLRPGYFARISGACEAAYGEEGEANARLIAAAPDMLAALRDLYIDAAGLIRTDGTANDQEAAMRRLRAAAAVIAKATGAA